MICLLLIIFPWVVFFKEALNHDSVLPAFCLCARRFLQNFPPVVDTFQVGLELWFDCAKRSSRTPKWLFKFTLCQVFQGVVVYELQLFQGNWDASIVIPEFKPRVRLKKNGIRKTCGKIPESNETAFCWTSG